MNAPQVADLVGRHVGRYRISRHLASGGMGAVYEVVQDRIGHRAAMKVMSGNLAKDPKHQKYVERFLDEARAVNLINHQGVLQIFDFGEMEDQTVYILMEFIDGQAVSNYTSKFREGAVKRMPLFQAMQIIRQVASVMAVAHAKSIVHRDIKPSNVMLMSAPMMPGGYRVKVIDFGLAKFLDTPERRTTAGLAVGTAPYMSPEQCLGEENFDGKVDVYSLGAMLYELLSGDPPFSGDIGAVMRQHVKEAPRPLSSVAGNIPPAVAKLVHRMLEKKKEARPTMEQVEAEIDDMEEKGIVQNVKGTALPEPDEGPVDTGAPTLPPAAVAGRIDKAERARAPLRPPKPGWIAALLGFGVMIGLLIGIVALGRSHPQPVPTQPPAAACPPAPTVQPSEQKAEAKDPSTAAKEADAAAEQDEAPAQKSKGKNKQGKAARKSK